MYAVNWDLVDRLGLARTALAGKTALVTGGARGIGEAAATTMSALGARVVIVDRLPTGQAVADAIDASGGRARFIRRLGYLMTYVSWRKSMETDRAAQRRESP